MVYKLSEFFVEVYYTCDELISSRIQIFLFWILFKHVQINFHELKEKEKYLTIMNI